MKRFYACRRLVIVFGASLVINANVAAQMRNNITPIPNTEVARVSFNNQLWVNAFYESLPNDYTDPSNATKRYPLIIFLHGAGQDGDGSLAGLQRRAVPAPGNEDKGLLEASLPQFIDLGTFPDVISLNGENYQPIVFIPQATQAAMGDCECPLSNTLFEEVVKQDLDFALTRYINRIDTTRIYLLGISKGGGWSWVGAGQSVSFASRLAGIVTMGGASNPVLGDRPANIAGANLPVLSVVSAGDGWLTRNQQWISGINNTVPAPAPLAILQTIPGPDHDVWTAASAPGYTIPATGGDVYHWMMAQQRIAEVLPVLLAEYKVTASNLNSGARKAVITWTTAHEQNNSFFTIERSADGSSFVSIGKVAAAVQGRGNSYAYTDNSPLPGINYYRLSQTDLDGSVKKFSAKLVSFQTAGAEGIKIYPNPVINDLVFELNNNVKGTLHATVITADGKVLSSTVYSKSDRFFSKAINISSLRKGYYMLKITGDNYLSTLRFVKE